MGLKLDEKLGEVCEACFTRCRAKHPSSKLRSKLASLTPIKLGMYIGHKMNGVTWIDFRYENMSMFYFRCGLIGHYEEHDRNPNSSNHGIKKINPQGHCLRSNQAGRKQVQQKDMLFSSNISKKKLASTYTPPFWFDCF